MDFEMTSSPALHAAVQRLREAGYEDASAGQRREGDPLFVLSVSTDDASAEDVQRIVNASDRAARVIGA